MSFQKGKMKAVVLAGGGGTRLWPLSRDDFPKQFLNFGSGLSLLQQTVLRLLKASFIEGIVVATNQQHLVLVERQLEKIGVLEKVKILVEPERRNTAPAIGLALKYLGEGSVLVLPSDHLIEPEDEFLEAVESMGTCEKMVTFGIRPIRAETGYGYIQRGEKVSERAFEVAHFKEKPGIEMAEKYLRDSNYFWNAGIFLFPTKIFWAELKAHAPVLSELFEGSYEEVVGKFGEMPNISIDYALMEKSKEVVVCPLSIAWSDVGCWDSVYEAMQKDQNQNVKMGHVLDIDTKNSLIIGESRLISTIGLEDMLIVETEDAVFIGKKGESQKVKSLMNELISRGRSQRISHSWGNSSFLDRGTGYVVKKIEVFAGKKTVFKKEDGVQWEWVCLSQDFEVDGDGRIENRTENSIYGILIEKGCSLSR